MAKLVLRTGSHAGTEYPIKDAHFSMGRRSQSNVPVSDAKASREHAVIHDQGGALFLQDLSRNGTLVNSKPALKTEPGTSLKFGDKISIGETTYELVDEKSEPIAIDIPGYAILEKVGAGGMGSVYKAKQLSMDRIVALKVLNERYSNNAEFVDRFIREARAAGKLNHPNVIHVHDISRANGRHYFSMEFIDGPSVRELLKKEKRIDVNKAMDIVMQAAKALEFAHDNRIVHRDIKPDNLMLTREGIVKIADLGIAKTFEEGGISGVKDRGVLGTPHYMAPEQAMGKAIDHRADIYSLGATFYHMITGHTPFSGGTAQEILKAHVQTSLSPIQELNKDVPDPVCFVIERMMAKLPEKRYQNMSRLIEDIERIQSGHVKGIERIEATDSSVLRAVKVPSAVSGRERQTEVQPRTARAKTKGRRASAGDETGGQIPVHKIVSALVWVVLLIGAIWAVIQLPKILSSKPVETEPVAKVDKNAKPSKAEPKVLLGMAKDAMARNDLKKFEIYLLEIKNKYPETIEAEAADKQLLDLARTNFENGKQNAAKALADAKKFETDNPSDAAGILAKYKAVVNVAGSNPAVFNEAKAKVDALEKGAATKTPGSSASASGKEVLDKAAVLKAAFDYDGVRKLLKDFIYSSQNLEDGAEARKQLTKADEEAKAKVKEFKDKTAALDPLAAAAEWGKYASVVKDEVNAPEVKPILEDLEEKTQTAAMEELGKASEKAKANKYADATTDVVAMQKKWAGLKWSNMASKKEASYKKQKALYDSFLKLLSEKVAAGPMPLPFPLQTKIKNQTKWQIKGVRDESIALDPIPTTAAPGVAVKLAEMDPKEQYQLIMLAMPKEPSKEQHAQLQAFCTERGLSDEADKHEAKANEK